MLGRTDGCRVCGSGRVWLKNRRGGQYPVEMEPHKQADEIALMIAEERIAKLQEERVLVVPEIVVNRKKRKHADRRDA